MKRTRNELEDYARAADAVALFRHNFPESYLYDKEIAHILRKRPVSTEPYLELCAAYRKIKKRTGQSTSATVLDSAEDNAE